MEDEARAATGTKSLQIRNGSDGTRTRDLRRDRPVQAKPVRPAATMNYRLEQAFPRRANRFRPATTDSHPAGPGSTCVVGRLPHQATTVVPVLKNSQPTSGCPAKWSGSQVRPRMWCADTRAPSRKAGASSASARTLACRAKEKRAVAGDPPAGMPTRKPRPARAGRSSPLIHASPAKSGEQLRCGGGCAPGVADVELRAWPHRRP
jgi:hypothetical protein